MNRLRVCLIGCGHMGRLRAKAILAGDRPVSLVVADAAEGASAALSVELGVPAITVPQALAGGFDAVVVASSAPAHLEQLVALADTDAFVFCEKPLAVSLDAVGAAWPALSALAGRFQIGFNRRFDPRHVRLAERIRQGAVGSVEQIRIASRDHVPPRPDRLGGSAGIIAETSIHDLDKARWLIGAEFVEVRCTAGVLVDPGYAAVGHADTVTILLTTAAGQQAIVQNGWRASFGYDQRVEVFGSEGELQIANPVAGGPVSASADDLLASPPRTFAGWAERYRDSFVAEIGAFLDCVVSRTPPAPGLEDGLAAQRLVEAARRAAASGGAVRVAG